jgi:hypothetical protein
MASHVTVRDVDHGYRKIVDRLIGASASKPVIRVGIQSAEGDEPHAKETFTAKQTGSAKFVKEYGAVADVRGVAGGKLRVAGSGDSALATVLEVAIFNEFGTNSIPARSFLRAWFDENREKIGTTAAKLMKSVVKGERTRDEVLELLGQWAVGQIQLRISAGIGPPNAASTVAQKGSSKPLIDSGVLRSSVTYRVDK